MPATNRAVGKPVLTTVERQALDAKKAEDKARAKAEAEELAQPPKPVPVPKTEPVDIEVRLNVKRWRGRSLVFSIAPEED